MVKAARCAISGARSPTLSSPAATVRRLDGQEPGIRDEIGYQQGIYLTAERNSVQPDYVVCLEWGFRGQILRRHLVTAHGLEPAAYRTRWKLASDHPLTTPAYSASRSVMAKQLGLGRKPAAPEIPAVPRRPGRPRRPTTS